jgi:glycosyltransferase involved in cell wall biosynthesis
LIDWAAEVHDQRPKRILYLVTEDWYFFSHRLSIALACKNSGWEVFVATRVGWQASRFHHYGLGVIPIRMERGSRNPIKEALSILEIVGLLRDLRPDIVHNVGLKPIVYGALATRLVGGIVSVSLFAGMGYLFQSGHLGMRLLRSAIKSVLRWSFANERQWVIAQNRDDASDIVRSRMIAADRVVVVKGSGIDLREFAPLPDPGGPVAVAVVGRMLRDKGIEDAVLAARELRRRGVPVKVLLAGEPDPDNPSSIPREVLTRWQAEGAVEWLGFVPDVRELWASTHIALLPSYREGLPKALLEAAACARPIVTTDVPGCREVVAHGVNGLLVSAGNPHGIADAIETLAASPELRARLGKSGRARVEAEFSDQIVIRNTESLYHLVLRKRKPARHGLKAAPKAN